MKESGRNDVIRSFKGRLKSIQASPSAEGDGWIDLTLIMSGMIEK